MKHTLPWLDVRRLSPQDLVHLYRTIIHELPQEAFVQLEMLLATYPGLCACVGVGVGVGVCVGAGVGVCVCVRGWVHAD